MRKSNIKRTKIYQNYHSFIKEKNMNNLSKRLKTEAFIVLILAAATLVTVVLELIFGDINSATVPEGSPANILMITKILLLSFTLVLLAPQIYVGVRGIMVANHPSRANAHIIVAMVVLVCVALSLVSTVFDVILNGGFGDSISTLLTSLLQLVVYLDYIRCAKALREAC